MKKSTLLKIVSVIALIVITAIACTKSDSENTVVITEAVVINSGAVAADGCGWLIKIPVTDSTYSPVNLAEDYKVNNLKIKVRFHPMSTKFTCGWGVKLREVTIDNITKIP
jgi:hypothetical protein